MNQAITRREVNTVSEQDCTYMDTWTQDQLHGAIEAARGTLEEQINTIVSGLMRLPEGNQRGKLAGEILQELNDRTLEIVAAG